MKNIDIILNEDYDITADPDTHDLVIGDVTLQNQALILVSQKGEWKEKPMVGCGLNGITNDDDITSWKRLIREELARDGIKINKLNINAQTIEIDAAFDIAAINNILATTQPKTNDTLKMPDVTKKNRELL